MATSKAIQRTISPALNAALLQYFETHPAAKLSRNLRCMLLDYLAYELRVGIPLYTDELLWQLQDLFELLDIAAHETQQWHVLPKQKIKHQSKRHQHFKFHAAPYSKVYNKDEQSSAQ